MKTTKETTEEDFISLKTACENHQININNEFNQKTK